MQPSSPFVVSPDWLQERLDEPGLIIIDGSWYLPAQGRDARAEFDAGHIPGAIFFDHDEVVEPGINLPHALPSPRHFAQYAGSMGISSRDTIVVYDGPGFFSAPRVWWMFHIMGAEKVYLLDGGLDAWKAAGRPLTDQPTKTAGCLFEVDFDARRVASLEDMRRIVESGEAGIDLEKPVVTSCGSGVTAAVITLALETLGHTDNKLYDGSWSEWGGLQDTPVVTGKE